jgi:hypothetical protein
LGTERGENWGFEGYFRKSDKIDGNWVRSSELAKKLKMTK